jgi:hypothetical protein
VDAPHQSGTEGKPHFRHIRFPDLHEQWYRFALKNAWMHGGKEETRWLTSVRRGFDDAANTADGRFSARIIVIQHAMLRPLHVVELSLLHRPDEDQPAAAAEKKREYY